MKTLYRIIISSLVLVTFTMVIISCSSTKEAYTSDLEDDFKIEKSGALLWGETCNRCHLAPSPADYNDTDWSTISLHMRVRANLTESEITKIEDFLKTAN